MKKLFVAFLSIALLMALAIPAAAEENGITETIDEETLTPIYTKTVIVDGKPVEFSDSDPNSPYLDESSALFQESLNSVTQSNQVEQDVETCKEEQAQLPEPMQDYSRCEPQYVVPDQYSSYRVSGINYNTFWNTSGYTYVKNTIILTASTLAGAMSVNLSTNDATKAIISIVSGAAAGTIVNSYHPDYTKTFYIKNWSSYYNMYTYRLVTNIYSDSSRISWSLQHTKVSGSLKKVGSYFYAL